MKIKYDDQDDILYVEFSNKPIVKDVSYGWSVNVGYAATGIADITILDYRTVMDRATVVRSLNHP